MSDVVQVSARSLFELEVDGQVAFLAYEESERDVARTHTVVPRELEGRGVGGRLAEAAVGWARSQGLEVLPVCSFVQGWLQRQPDVLT